jgi:hypothetical protein
MTEPETTFTERLPRRNPRAIAALIGAGLVLVVGAAVTMGATPSASPDASGSTASPPASTDPAAPNEELRDGRPGPFGGFGRFGGPGHIAGLGGPSIAAINGASVRLETEDGWTRTITITDDTTLSRGDETIELADLEAGDRVALRQTRNDDGSFTVTELHVLLPTIGGTVSAVTDDSITVAGRDGSTQTIHVDGDTTFDVAGDEDATIDDVEVGMRIVAVGEARADGSLDASAVHAGSMKIRGEHWGGTKPGDPAPSASPDSSTNG